MVTDIAVQRPSRGTPSTESDGFVGVWPSPTREDLAASAERALAELALAALWPLHHHELVRYVSHLLTGDIHTAEDVAQETAMRLWQRREIVTDGQPLTGWLHTVARNIVVDRFRRRRARPTEVFLAPGIDDEAPDDLERIDAFDSVTRILSGLEPLHRRVVFEVYVRDRPVADVAADLGIPTGTVKSRCHNALRRLRDTHPADPRRSA